jgi:hypothetical protein
LESEYSNCIRFAFTSSFQVASSGKKKSDRPYIAAKFLQRAIPYTFVLGNMQNYEGFINRKLEPGVFYKVFVRAYVDTPQKHLYTSSPFSPELSLDMTQVRSQLRRSRNIKSINIVSR